MSDISIALIALFASVALLAGTARPPSCSDCARSPAAASRLGGAASGGLLVAAQS